MVFTREVLAFAYVGDNNMLDFVPLCALRLQLFNFKRQEDLARRQHRRGQKHAAQAARAGDVEEVGYVVVPISKWQKRLA